MSKKLLLRPKPYDDESFMGYLLRLTEINDYQTVSNLVEGIGASHLMLHARCSFLHNMEAYAQKASEMTGNPLHRILAMAYPRLPDEKKRLCLFGREPIILDLLCAHKPRFCPCCLREKLYFRRMWDFSLITTCPFHQVLLIDRCPNCQKPIIYPNREHLVKCSCNYDLSQSPAQKIFFEETRFTRLLYGACKIQPNWQKEDRTPLRRLRLLDLTTAMKVAAGFLQNDQPNDRISYQVLINQSLPVQHTLLCKAYEMFTEWPHRYHDFLRKLPERLHDLPPNGSWLVKNYGKLYLRMFTRTFPPALHFMRESFHSFLVNQSKEALLHTRWSQQFGRRAANPAYTREEACALLGISDKRVAQLLNDGVLKGTRTKVITPNNCVKYVYQIDKRHVHTIRFRQSKAMKLAEAAEFLHLPIGTLHHLIKAGVIHPIAPKQLLAKENCLHFYRHCLERIVDRISAQTSKNTIPASELISYNEMVKIMWRLKVNHCKVFVDLMKGKFHATTQGTETGLARFSFSSQELVEYARSKGHQTSEGEISSLLQKIRAKATS